MVLEYAGKGQIMEYENRDKKFKPNADGRTHYSEREI
jgi:hypothetical protein